ncbi:hypothetical protein Tco_0146234 [Tanacetum coccineum]
MNEINIDDLTIEQYLSLMQENQASSMVKKVNDMTIAEYLEYEEMTKRQYSRNFGSYFPTYYGNYTSNHNMIMKFPHNTYFNHVLSDTEFNYDSKDMELDEEADYTTEEESIMKEVKVVIKKKQIDTSEDYRIKEVSSMACDDTMEDDGVTTTSPCQLPMKLSPRSFLLPFTIDDYNSYALANLDAA